MEDADKGTREVYKKLVDIVAKWEASRLSKEDRLKTELGKEFIKSLHGDMNNADFRLYSKDVAEEIMAELQRNRIKYVEGPNSNGQVVIFTSPEDADKVKACQRRVYCTHPEHYNETTVESFLSHEKNTEKRCAEIVFENEQQQNAFRKFANNHEKGFVITNTQDGERHNCVYASAVNMLGDEENTGICDALVMTGLAVGGTNWDLKSAKMCWDMDAENQIVEAIENGSTLYFANEGDNQSSYLLVENHQLKLFERDANGDYGQIFNSLTNSEGERNLRAAMQSFLSKVNNKKAMLPHDFDEFMNKNNEEVKAEWITKLCKDAATLGVLDINDEKIPEITESLTCRPTLDDMFAKAKDVKPVKFFLRKEFREPLRAEFERNAPADLTKEEREVYAAEKLKDFEMKYSIEFEQEYLKNKLSTELIENSHLKLTNRKDLITPESQIMAYKDNIGAALPNCAATTELRAWLDAINADPVKKSYLSRVGGTNEHGSLLSFAEIKENIYKAFQLVKIRNITDVEREQKALEKELERTKTRIRDDDELEKAIGEIKG